MPEMRNADFGLLCPAFRTRLEAGLVVAQGQGLAVYLFEGWRSPSRQGDLYAQGRTLPGELVTDAKPWDSFHQYGCAGDLVFGGPGKWTWQGDWDKLVSIMEAQGLEWGGRWRSFTEDDHFQYTGGLTLVQAKSIQMAKGVLGVWEAIAEATTPQKGLTLVAN